MPSSLPVSVHVAPSADSGSPVMVRIEDDGVCADGLVSGTWWWHATRPQSNETTDAARNARIMIH